MPPQRESRSFKPAAQLELLVCESSIFRYVTRSGLRCYPSAQAGTFLAFEGNENSRAPVSATFSPSIAARKMAVRREPFCRNSLSQPSPEADPAERRTRVCKMRKNQSSNATAAVTTTDHLPANPVESKTSRYPARAPCTLISHLSISITLHCTRPPFPRTRLPGSPTPDVYLTCPFRGVSTALRPVSQTLCRDRRRGMGGTQLPTSAVGCDDDGLLG